jgi:COP9 signalosome complex subunit 1
MQTRHYVDIHLSTHVQDLTRLIRDKCLVLYLKPFASIKLERMSAAFGWSVDDVEKAVVGLIQSGEIKARVDSLNKVNVVFAWVFGKRLSVAQVLKAREVDARAELYVRAITAGADMQSATRKLLLRLRL